MVDVAIRDLVHCDGQLSHRCVLAGISYGRAPVPVSPALRVQLERIDGRE
jgi:hypothetical protein